MPSFVDCCACVTTIYYVERKLSYVLDLMQLTDEPENTEPTTRPGGKGTMIYNLSDITEVSDDGGTHSRIDLVEN